MKPQVLYATSNPGKLEEVGRFLQLNGIELLSPSQVGGEIEVPETGTPFIVVACKEKFSKAGGLLGDPSSFLLQLIRIIKRIKKSLLAMVRVKKRLLLQQPPAKCFC